MERVPYLSRDLVSQLDALHPARPPNPKDSEREIWMKAGERRLIEGLMHTIQEQDENVLDDPVTSSNPME